MRKIGWVFVGFLAAAAAVGCGGADDVDESTPVVRPTTSLASPKSTTSTTGRKIVVFKSNALPADAAARIAAAGGRTKGTVASIGVALFEGDDAAVGKLAADGAVAAVGAEHAYPAPQVRFKRSAAAPASPAPDFLWGAQWDQRRIKANVAWNNVAPSAQASVTVAVLDSGVMSDHPDLLSKVTDTVATNISSLLGCQGPQGPDPSYPLYFTRINLVTGDLCEPVFDQASVQPHGTHVAGTVAANYGGGVLQPYGFPGGVVGVAPAAKIAAYKIFDRVVLPTPAGPMEVFTATDYAIFSAIADAANKGYPVINMSLGGMIDREDPMMNASWVAMNRVARLATQKGTLIVAAAGNDNTNNNGSIAFVPSDLPNVLSVAATGTSALGPGAFPFGPYDATGADVRAFYSNYGAAVNVSAPGGDCGPAFQGTPESCDPRHLVVSSVPYWDASTGTFGAAWDWYAGTSMASPHVAGIAALVKAKNPSFSPAQVRARIEQTAKSLGDRQAFGMGLVDADLATR